MSAWTGKYVIGLTGNIATGKSVVRRMLEHLGAYGIDADALAHRAIAQGAPGYKPIVEIFGRWVLGEDGEIDRARLGRVVFSDAEALARLESIIHPLVAQAVDVLVRRAQQRVIVIEAIKLLESSLRSRCDSLWVTYAPPEIQLARLTHKRKIDEGTARQRIRVQPPQEEKVGAANVVIRNQGSYEQAWQQVVSAWQRTIAPVQATAPQTARSVQGELSVERANPRQAEEIAAFITRLSAGRRRVSRDDIMAAFGEKAYLQLKAGDQFVGLVGWQVENLVARVNDFYLDPTQQFAPALKALTAEVERASRELQCEVALFFLIDQQVSKNNAWRTLGYQPATIVELGVRAWQEAAAEIMPGNAVMLYKLLREDRVLRPV
jgi:dephospho-CoA kinase